MSRVIAFSLVGLFALAVAAFVEREIYVFACQHGVDWKCYGVDR